MDRRARQRPRHRLLALVLVLLALPGATVACGTALPDAGDTPLGGTGTVLRDAAPVDFSVPGPYPVGRLELRIGATTATVYYPVEPDAAARARHSTSYNTADAYAPALRASVAPLVPELALDLPQDVALDAPINHEGPFPIVVHSHGTGGSAQDASAHLRHLASWGFVAAAPEHTSRDVNALAANAVVTDGNPDVADLAETLRALTRENTRPSSPLLTGIDTTSVAAEGVDAGARAAYLFAASEPRVKLWVGDAPEGVVPEGVVPEGQPPASSPGAPAPSADPAPPPPPAADPSTSAPVPVLGRSALVITGDADSLVPLADVQATYGWLGAPKRLAVVRRAGHAAFVDACAPVQRAGGLGRYAEALPALVPLLERNDDGCAPGSIDAALATRAIDHLTIAAYRHALGADASDVSLRDDFLQRTFPAALAPLQAVAG